jgi:hypothetical protein
MPASTYPSVDDSRDRLHRGGWSIGESGGADVWLVTGTNGKNAIRTEGRSQAEAWHRAVLQAEAIIQKYTLMRVMAPPAVRMLSWLAWLWLVAALPFLTDASCNLFVGFALSGTWLLLAVAWLVMPFSMPAFLLQRAARRRWLAAGFAGSLGLILAFTDVGLMIRIALCEASLSGYAAQIPPNDGNSLHVPQPVGLFLVNGEENYQGIIFLYTSSAFINREGVAYVPPSTLPPSQLPRRRLRHLYGPWYCFTWKF